MVMCSGELCGFGLVWRLWNGPSLLLFLFLFLFFILSLFDHVMWIIPGEEAPEECESTRLTALHRTSSELLAESTIPQQLGDGFDRSRKEKEDKRKGTKMTCGG